jgi:uncharacterized protein
VTGAASTIWLDITRSFREAFFMFWATLWPLILGFGVSGAVQAFATRETMQRQLGDLRPASVARASGYGMVSSSCSYAASAMAKSLFAKGADFVAACVFMFASTNLVIELGIVLLVLLGWQFAVSEFVGGAIMIVLLVLLGGLWLRGRVVVEARRRVERQTETQHHPRPEGDDRRPLTRRIRSSAGWADASTYTMSDLSMLRREMVAGYLVAGFLATLVPVSVWHAVFLQGHGFWTSLQNVVVGPFIAIVSFVCSIGNVPLAAALWQGGISFGGVVSFIFADLLTLPLLLIYRRFYGTRVMLRMLAVFWVVISLAGLITEGIFSAAGLIPATRPTQIVADHLSWNYTTILNLVFLGLFGLLYWTYRNRDRLGAGERYARDPVCGMQVETALAPASTVHEGRPVHFCSDRCRLRFAEEPSRFPATEQVPPTVEDTATADVPGSTAAAHPGHAH